MSGDLALSIPRHPCDPGAPHLRVSVVASLALAASGAAWLAVALGPEWHRVAVVGAALVAGELLSIRVAEGTSLALWHALVPSLAATTPGVGEAVAVATAAQLAALPGRIVGMRGGGREGRGVRHVVRVAERLAGTAAGAGAFRAVSGAVGGGVAGESAGALAGERLVAATVSAAGATLAVALAAVALGARLGRDRGREGAGAWPAAAFALGSGGTLMALALSAGPPAPGLWGLPVFAVPLLATRFAFERLHAIRRTYEQTLEVLSRVPELGGRARPGGARRVAELCFEVGRRLGLGPRELDHLHRAALLHGLGHLILDDPDRPARPVRSFELARVTAGMLGDTAGLSRPTTLVADAPAPGAAREGGDVAARILEVVLAFEEAAGGEPGHEAEALDRLVSAPPGTYDPEVVSVLQVVVAERGGFIRL